MATDKEISRRTTVPGMEKITGNLVFVQAAEALGLDPVKARQVLSDVVLARGVQPSQLTHDQLRSFLPDIEKRLRLFVNDSLTGAIMSELRRFVTSAH